MVHKQLLVLLFIITPSFCFSADDLVVDDQAILEAYELKDGPIKEKLDRIIEKHNLIEVFSTKPAQQAKGVFREAGFSFLKGCRITEHPSVPGFIFKLGRQNRKYQHVSRVWIADEMSRVIAEKKLTHIIIPEKFLYHLPGKPKTLCDDNYAVLSEKLHFHSDHSNRDALKKLPIETLREIITLIEAVVYNDPSPNNIRVMRDGEHIAIIDTEKIHWKRAWTAERCVKQFRTYLSDDQKKALDEEESHS